MKIIFQGNEWYPSTYTHVRHKDAVTESIKKNVSMYVTPSILDVNISERKVKVDIESLVEDMERLNCFITFVPKELVDDINYPTFIVRTLK